MPPPASSSSAIEEPQIPLVEPKARHSERALRRLLSDIGAFSRYAVGLPLRPYQLEPARAILDSIWNKRGLTFTVMMSRQSGKNELSAQLEAYLLVLFSRMGGSIVKAAPTFKPQVINSKLRLEKVLSGPLTAGRWRSLFGYMIRYGKAQVVFFSAEPGSNVVGATANILLEMDEAQDIEEGKYQKDFRPMGATANVTTVLYGTAWSGDTLLERIARLNRDLEARDGVRRHFQYPWEAVAEHLPAYGQYVEGEMGRLGAEHPLVRTQYMLQSIAAQARFFSPQQLAQMRGDHPRQPSPAPPIPPVHGGGKGGRPLYVAGVDIAGQEEHQLSDWRSGDLPSPTSHSRDSTVITVAEVDPSNTISDLVVEPRLRIVEHYAWTGRKHREVFPQMVDLLKNLWRCRAVVVDATGMGAPVASFLQGALGEEVVVPYIFSAPSKSKLAYGLLAAVNAGRVKMYREDGSPEYREFWAQMEAADYSISGNQTMNFYVDPSKGHDDYLMSLALLVEATGMVAIRRAVGRLPRQMTDHK